MDSIKGDNANDGLAIISGVHFDRNYAYQDLGAPLNKPRVELVPSSMNIPGWQCLDLFRDMLAADTCVVTDLKIDCRESHDCKLAVLALQYSHSLKNIDIRLFGFESPDVLARALANNHSVNTVRLQLANIAKLVESEFIIKALLPNFSVTEFVVKDGGFEDVGFNDFNSTIINRILEANSRESDGRELVSSRDKIGHFKNLYIKRLNLVDELLDRREFVDYHEILWGVRSDLHMRFKQDALHELSQDDEIQRYKQHAQYFTVLAGIGLVIGGGICLSLLDIYEIIEGDMRFALVVSLSLLLTIAIGASIAGVRDLLKSGVEKTKKWWLVAGASYAIAIPVVLGALDVFEVVEGDMKWALVTALAICAALALISISKGLGNAYVYYRTRSALLQPRHILDATANPQIKVPRKRKKPRVDDN